jgi:hypothetical protein
MRKGNFITTYNKINFYPFDPKKDEILLDDIAHALSMICRGNGHINHFYSVAQHSVNCCIEARQRGYSKEVQLTCLLHDASEAYLSDITRPVKKHLPEYLVIEAKLQNMIYSKYHIDYKNDKNMNKMKVIDDSILLYEKKYLMNFDVIPDPMESDINICEESMSKIKSDFIHYFYLLYEDVASAFCS